MTMSDFTFHRVLVANRAEVAVRVFRTARRLGLETVAIASDPDLLASWTTHADLVVPLGGSTPRESYLDVDKVLDAAARSGATAIHPGYGFLAEDSAFAAAVIETGLVWIGPSPESMRAMAGKVEAKRIAAQAGVPLVPGAELDGTDTSAWQHTASQIGYPLLVKASAGGGGKGMRIVADDSQLVESIETAQREAASAFGDSTVFIERYVQPAHHIEVQIFGDTHGNVVHLLDRECSVQRRHQKVIEEAPAPALTDVTREHLRSAAVSLAKAISYVGAGTVEFVVTGDGNDQEFFFLEMNTRLQVEHPVTEFVTGTDLVEWQFLVASGAHLPLAQHEIRPHGHAIEVRLYAEDPGHDWMPGHGRIHEFAPPASPALRVDSGVASGDDVTTFYDPMLAKVIAHASTRNGAAAQLASGLRRFAISGPTTNRDTLVAVLEHEAFKNAATPTSFFADHPEVLAPAAQHDVLTAHLLASAYIELDREQTESPIPFAPAGWRNVFSGGTTVTIDHAGVQHQVTQQRHADGTATWLVDDNPTSAHVVASAGGDGPGLRVHVTLDGVRRTVTVASHDDSVWCTDGLHSTHLSRTPRFAATAHEGAVGGPETPVPGTITAVMVSVGDSVAAGDTLVVLEAMKMEHRIKADLAGTVTAVRVNVGDNVDAHYLVAEVEPEATSEGVTP